MVVNFRNVFKPRCLTFTRGLYISNCFLLLGYLFGGLYSDTVNNVITKAKKCPIKFYPQRFGPKDMYVCISDDYELGAQYSIPFGGFMSCTAGNPLAMTPRKGENVL